MKEEKQSYYLHLAMQVKMSINTVNIATVETSFFLGYKYLEGEKYFCYSSFYS
jgi:hypothetical protein